MVGEVQKVEGLQTGAPPLGLLQLEMRVNVSDSQLLSNLNYVKELGVPAIQLMEPNKKTLAICGSGPSLRNTCNLIPADADIMALNGAYRFLRKQGKAPTYFAMLDSREVNVNLLEELHPETTYLLASQCHPKVFDRLWLNEFVVGTFHLGTPTTRSVFPDQDLYVGGGGTIGLTAIALAVALGYRSVILYGMDSSFDGEKRHVVHQPQNDGEEIIPVWVDDRKYMTSMAMADQVMQFFPFHKALREAYPDVTIDIIGDGLFYDFVVTNNNPSSRDRELAKYVDAYKEDNYGMSLERAKGLAALLSRIPFNGSYLDVSCGRAESLNLARQLGFGTVQGTETVEALCGPNVVHAVLPTIPFADKSFDTVSLIEVIEHLVPDDIVPTLNELTRLARHHILISAAIYEHWIAGVNLHPSAMPVEKWEEIFKSVWGDNVYRVGSLGSSPCWRVDL